jgi:glucodextranase-like protein/Big-like domain-containing protein
VRIKHFAVTVIPLVLLCLVLSNLLLRAQNSLLPNPDFVDALWVARSHGISKVSTSTAAVLFEMADTQNVRAMALDEPRGVLWAYDRKTLRAYGFGGQLLHSVPLEQHNDDDESQDAVLSVNPVNGAVWVGIKKRLYYISAHGEWLMVHTLTGHVRALAWDMTTACLWVGTKETVRAIDETGTVCASLNLGAHADVKDLALDADSGALWVGMQKSLRHYEAGGALRFEMRIDKLASLALDGQGGVWVATDRDLIRLDRSGQVRADLEPFADHDKIVAVVTDPRDASVWVASKKKLSHLRSDGHRLHALALRGDIRELAFYADVIPPSLTLTAPQDGDLLNTNRPTITLQYHDSGVGVALATLGMQANGIDVPLACQPSAATAACAPGIPLPEGHVTLTATVADYAGNSADAPEVQVTIDTVAPVIILTTPADGLVTNQPQQVFAGTLSEAATLALNGAAAHVGVDGTFSHGPLPLYEGLNTFELVATDATGNLSRRRVRVTLDTTPPAAVVQGQLQVGDVEDGHAQVSGAIGSVEAGGQVTLTNTRTGQAVTVTAQADGSFTATLAAQSGDVLAFVVADAAGNISPETPVPVGRALPPDPRSVAPPLDRTVATDLASATAFLYTGNNPIQMG